MLEAKIEGEVRLNLEEYGDGGGERKLPVEYSGDRRVRGVGELRIMI